MTAIKVSAAVVGQHLGISRQRVGQLADEGVIGRGPDGCFDIDQSRLAYIRWLRADDRRAVKSEGTDRMRDARAAEIEQRMAERQGRMVAEAQAETLRIVDEVCGPLKSDLMALPARVTADIALRRKIESGIDEAFNSAANRAEDAADRVPASEKTLAVAAPSARGGKGDHDKI